MKMNMNNQNTIDMKISPIIMRISPMESLREMVLKVKAPLDSYSQLNILLHLS